MRKAEHFGHRALLRHDRHRLHRGQARGPAGLRRVTRTRIVLFTWDPRTANDSWVVRDYFPGFVRFCPRLVALEETLERLGGGRTGGVAGSPDRRGGVFPPHLR